MLIESKIHRPKGTTVTLGDETYHFVSDGAGRHVAEVENEDHVDRLLSITDGYRIARAAVDQDMQVATTPAPDGNPPGDLVPDPAVDLDVDPTHSDEGGDSEGDASDDAADAVEQSEGDTPVAQDDPAPETPAAPKRRRAKKGA